MDFKINVAAVIVSVLINFVIGFVWFTPLFGKIWGKEMRYGPNIKPNKKEMT